MAQKAQVDQLKRQHGRKLLSLPGVSGVGVERGDADGDYVLVVHVDDTDDNTRTAVMKEVGGKAVKIVKSGPYRKF